MIMCLVTLGGHFGRDRTLEKATSRFFWEDMYDDIRDRRSLVETEETK